MDQEKIGKFIYDLRKKYNLTQKELADKLHVTAQAVSKWENGRGVPDIELLKKLSEEFDVSVAELIEGEKSVKKNNKLGIIISIGLIVIVIVVIVILLVQKNDETFTFSSLVCDNDSFNISGVIAYNDAKRSVYISNISYCDEFLAEPKVIAVECILYEMVNGEEKEIAKYGSLDDYKDSTYISDYLSNVEFNIDDYTCGCSSNTCTNLNIRINALNNDKELITYEIPISIDNFCN